jgi:molybdate transport system substrate-binding protein
MRRAALAPYLLLLVTSCASGSTGSASAPPSSTTSPSEALTVYAAASLQDAFEAIADAYGDETGVEIVLSFDSSSALRTQISEGAPADLFASADLVNAQQLVDEDLTDGGAIVFAANALAIVVPAEGAESEVTEWQALADPGVRIVAAAEDVPITGYADELLDNLAALPDAPPEFVDAYAANVVSREDNVRAALAKVEIGDGDAAIVYETDASSSTAVATVPVPEEANVVAEYASVTLADAAEGTVEFASWLGGPEALAILEELGFRPPPG